MEGLLPNSNYSVRVAAATGVGAGPLSQPVFCSTHEDGQFRRVVPRVTPRVTPA